MRTRERLERVFSDAFPVPFDGTSKFVFFGDVHRGDDSLSDEFGRNRHIYYHALNHYYESGFTYVEVGDGDELLEQPRYKHIYTAHVTTFEMLKLFYNDGRMIMIYGNHNRQLRNLEYVKKNLYRSHDEFSEIYEDLFPGIDVHEAIILKHRKTGQEIFVVHGHQGDVINDQLWPIAFLTIRYFWRFMHILGVKYAASPAKNINRRHKVERNFNRWNCQHDIMLICGHTHRPKFPRPGEPSYFNTGCCIHPRGITCLEISKDEVSLISWRTHTRKDGTLFIKRTVLQGPEPIIKFHKALTQCGYFTKKKRKFNFLNNKEVTDE
ncbi:MAG: metallophosphoesterase family protein [Eubacteriales bacterium]|nr:metallophosphoesterase family protein [Eubacteriales bacterium]MDD4583813.1 metallophosphoesterase family protein [Eubacteriales bacterium]